MLVFRTGHHRRRLEHGAWDNGPTGEGKAGLHVDTLPWMHERRVAAFLPDGDGETVPSTVISMFSPFHPLQFAGDGHAGSRQLAARGRGRRLPGRRPLRGHGGGPAASTSRRDTVHRMGTRSPSSDQPWAADPATGPIRNRHGRHDCRGATGGKQLGPTLPVPSTSSSIRRPTTAGRCPRSRSWWA